MDKMMKRDIKSLVSQGKYDEVYYEYGREAYKKYVPLSYRQADLKELEKEGNYVEMYNKHGVMTETTRARIEELKKEGEYDQIFREFDQVAYKKNTPFKYRRADLRKLKQEGRYEDIYNKYGARKYNDILTRAMYNDIKNTKGLGAAIRWRVKEIFKRGVSVNMVLATVLSAEMAYLIAGEAEKSEQAIAKNGEIYVDDINNYNRNVERYAYEINQYGFSDLQIGMKVMDDMWRSIQGYAAPARDIIGYLELDLATKDGYGVCRNMASDVAKKMNAINSKYNARTMNVYMESGGEYTKADIERNILETNSTVVNNEGAEEEQEDDTMQRMFGGNHMIVLIDIPDDNLILVLDPTNAGVGVYINGKITMFNSGKGENPRAFDSKELATGIITGRKRMGQAAEDYVRSFQKPNLTWEELWAKYGVEAQNEALDVVRRNAILEAADRAGIESRRLQNEFDQRYRVGPVYPTSDSKSNDGNRVEKVLEEQ